jgi:CheY-like chemotaxis protein
VQTIRTSGDSLLGVINDVLDFSKIEAGRVELENAPFELRGCVEDALDLLAQQAADKRLELAYVCDADVPLAVCGDVARLRQVLVNLVSNAIKFTAAGEVVVGVSSRRLDGDSHELRFTVRDTGVGIPAERMDRLFHSFSQLDASTTRKYGGTGLGLAISKRFVELMNGAIWVTSTVGVGSTFEFTIVARTIHRAPSGERHEDVLRGKQVLIVAAGTTLRSLLARELITSGMHVRTVASPAEALDCLRARQRFVAAILDAGQEPAQAVAAIGAIRSGHGGSALPALLLSPVGVVPAGWEKLATDRVPTTILTKPVKPVRLRQALAALLGAEAKPEASSGASLEVESTAPVPLRILLAEDNRINQKVALKILERLGYRADVAANGLEVLRALERQAYDVVLMDAQMPEMDGLEAARQIHERIPSNMRPRVIAMTANAMREDREACLAAHMDDFIGKPFVPEQLAAALERCKPSPSQSAPPVKALAS